MNRFEVGAVSDRGLSPRRPINEDRYLAMPEKGLFVVADGVGGELAGEVASQIVVDALAEAMRDYNFDGDLEKYLGLILQRANRKIYEEASTHKELSGMASTVALICAQETQATIAHVGDSRVYSYSSGRLKRETRDHTDTEDALRSGMMTEMEAQNNSTRNVINRAVGAESEVEPEFNHIDLSRTDAILLCTDGITRHIPDYELKEVLNSKLTPQQMCDELKWRCHCRGAEDNLTAVIVKMSKADEERTLQPSKPKARIEQKEQSGKASRIQVKVYTRTAESAPEREPDPLSLSERGAGSVSEPRSRSVFGAGLKMLLGALLLTGAFYTGIYVAQNYFPAERPQPGIHQIGDELGTSSNLREGAQANPDFQNALQLFDNREYIAARDRFQTLTEHSPGNARYYYWLGRANFEGGDYNAALKGFQKAISLNLGVPTVYLYEALSYQALGREKEAAQSFKRFSEERMKKPVTSDK